MQISKLIITEQLSDKWILVLFFLYKLKRIERFLRLINNTFFVEKIEGGTKINEKICFLVYDKFFYTDWL